MMNSDSPFFQTVSPHRGLWHCGQPDLNVPQVLDEENVPFNPDQDAMEVCCHWVFVQSSPLTPLQGFLRLRFYRPNRGALCRLHPPHSQSPRLPRTLPSTS